MVGYIWECPFTAEPPELLEQVRSFSRYVRCNARWNQKPVLLAEENIRRYLANCLKIGMKFHEEKGFTKEFKVAEIACGCEGNSYTSIELRYDDGTGRFINQFGWSGYGRLHDQYKKKNYISYCRFSEGAEVLEDRDSPLMAIENCLLYLSTPVLKEFAKHMLSSGGFDL